MKEIKYYAYYIYKKKNYNLVENMIIMCIGFLLFYQLSLWLSQILVYWLGWNSSMRALVRINCNSIMWVLAFDILYLTLHKSLMNLSLGTENRPTSWFPREAHQMTRHHSESCRPYTWVTQVPSTWQGVHLHDLNFGKDSVHIHHGLDQNHKFSQCGGHSVTSSERLNLGVLCDFFPKTPIWKYKN